MCRQDLLTYPIQGLLGVYSRYGLHTRAVTVYRDTLTRGFSHFVTSMTAPVASGWSGLPGGAYTHWKAPPLHGAHPHRTSISRHKRVTLRSHWVPNYAHRPSPEICSRDEIDEEPNTRRNHRPRAAPQRAWEMNRFAVQSRRRACLPSRRHSAPRSCPSSQCSTRL